MIFDQSELSALYRYSLALCHDRDEAYDLLYSNIEKQLKSRTKAAHVKDKMQFMKRCIRNSYLDLLRHNKVRLIKSDILQTDQYELQQQIDTLEEHAIKQNEVEHLLESLKSEERELLYLWAVEDYTAQEIADLQGGGRGTWLSRIQRIKTKLRKGMLTAKAPMRGNEL